MKAALALLLCLALLPAARAADPPENVYASFHRAAVAGDLDRMLLYAPAARRKEMARLPPAQKAAQAKIIGAMLPRTYVIQAKTVDASGLSLHVSGMSTPPKGQPSEMLYGSVQMHQEGGDWKVGRMNWSNKPPTGAAAGKKPAPSVAAAKPPTGRYAVNLELGVAPGSPAAKPAPAVPAVRTGPVRPSGTTVGTTPERKLGTAKPPCVYKPAMTAEDLENCK